MGQERNSVHCGAWMGMITAFNSFTPCTARCSHWKIRWKNQCFPLSVCLSLASYLFTQLQGNAMANCCAFYHDSVLREGGRKALYIKLFTKHFMPSTQFLHFQCFLNEAILIHTVKYCRIAASFDVILL